MKSRRGRKFLRKILEFFHLSAPCAPVIAPPLYTTFPNGNGNAPNGRHSDHPPQYSTGADTDKSDALRHDMEEQIVHLWKKVYLGLYEIEDSDKYRARSHYDRLEALYLGAGLTRSLYLHGLKVIKYRFSLCGGNTGVLSLKLFDNLSISTLRSMIEILEAYEKEIVNLVRLETLLRNSQRPLFPAESDPSVATNALRKEYLDIAGPMGKRIEWYDIRMEVLNHDIHNEAMVLDKGRHRLKGQYVYHRAFLGRLDS